MKRCYIIDLVGLYERTKIFIGVRSSTNVKFKYSGDYSIQLIKLL